MYFLRKNIFSITDSLGSEKISEEFEKTFDTVSHDILLEKLNYYGIRGISYEIDSGPV